MFFNWIHIVWLESDFRSVIIIWWGGLWCHFMQKNATALPVNTKYLPVPDLWFIRTWGRTVYLALVPSFMLLVARYGNPITGVILLIHRYHRCVEIRCFFGAFDSPFRHFLMVLLYQQVNNYCLWNGFQIALLCFNFGDKINWRVKRFHCSLYTFDMRNLSRAACVHMDHVLSGMLSHIYCALTAYIHSLAINEDGNDICTVCKQIRPVIVHRWWLDSFVVTAWFQFLTLTILQRGKSLCLAVTTKQSEFFLHIEATVGKYIWDIPPL